MNQPAFRAFWDYLPSFLARTRTLRGTLKALIREDESAVGFDRTDVRSKAKIWLVDHGTLLAADDILLAKDHFGYLLPSGWGS
jgi:hypothetical protein